MPFDEQRWPAPPRADRSQHGSISARWVRVERGSGRAASSCAGLHQVIETELIVRSRPDENE